MYTCLAAFSVESIVKFHEKNEIELRFSNLPLVDPKNKLKKKKPSTKFSKNSILGMQLR